MSTRKPDTLTTEWGAPAPGPTAKDSLSAGVRGPLLLSDTYLVSKLAHFDRERIPERVVHAKGAGAHGYFEVTHDISAHTRAALFAGVGKRTPVFTRFSTVGGERGSADSERDPRGFAVNFYTEEGIWSLVANNVPVFFIRDPLQFPDLIHTQKRNPATNLKDADAVWDFFTAYPESSHMVTILYSDRGTPRTYRHMNGYSGHALRLVNAAGVGTWVKFHMKTETGISCFTDEEATVMKGTDPDCATRDLYEHIAKGGVAAWKVYAQLMSDEDAAKLPFNPFDLTKIWPHADFPLIPVGRLVLNRNPENYFAEVEQAAFSPGNLVPGIELSPDPMLLARTFSYPDSQRHRLGPNYLQLPINCPFASKVRNQQRDGAMCLFNAGGEPNYFTGLASTGGAQAVDPRAIDSPLPVSGTVGRFSKAPADPVDDFKQAGDLYRKVMKPEEQARLARNLAGQIRTTRADIQTRALRYLNMVDKGLGAAVASLVATSVAPASRIAGAAAGAAAV